jgi:tetratricopeptide (TPR) repeat protein
MGELSRRFPDDLDAATLYAESAMNLHPWDLWSHDGKPRDGTQEILAVLESVLRRNPDHVGANHYYIHAIEASPTPERGLEAARRLGSLAPKAGHLVHMPAHIFHRVGDYAAAAEINEKAIAVDRDYLHKHKVHGIYPMMYYSHNLHFLAVAHAMQGRFTSAKKAADQLTAHVGPHVKDMPMLEGFLPTATLISVRFRRWDDILKLPEPDKKQAINRCIWHFARDVAHASRKEIEAAEKEMQAFRELQARIPEEAMFGPRNAARKVLLIPEQLLAAQIVLAKDPKQVKIGIDDHLKSAVVGEDALNYMEPSDWYLHVRETMGGALLRSGDPAQAEKVFRADLERNRRNGRSLFGLMQSLQAQGKIYAAQMVQQEFEAAWRNAEAEYRQLRVEDL